jgi:hypothetical protein
VPLAHVPARLRAEFGTATTYRVLYARVLDGDVPATKINGRWHIEERHLPAVAHALQEIVR